MRRREFISLAGCAAAWPAFAQRAGAPKRVGILAIGNPNDTPIAARMSVLREALQGLGWREGRDIAFDIRGGSFDASILRAAARELVASKPDVQLAIGTPASLALRQETTTIPIVFIAVSDPVTSGLVASMARPGGNLTGFINQDFPLAGKWAALLKEIAPEIKRILLLMVPNNPGNEGMLNAAREAGAKLDIAMEPARSRDRASLVSAIEDFASGGGGGLIVVSSILNSENAALIASTAARHRLPAICPEKEYMSSGALMSYGPDSHDLYRKGAGYIDRILRGTNPADLPVQAPTRYELIINLKTAKALGLNVPQTLQVAADEVIE